jgi:hypothetical protein
LLIDVSGLCSSTMVNGQSVGRILTFLASKMKLLLSKRRVEALVDVPCPSREYISYCHVCRQIFISSLIFCFTSNICLSCKAREKGHDWNYRNMFIHKFCGSLSPRHGASSVGPCHHGMARPRVADEGTGLRYGRQLRIH